MLYRNAWIFTGENGFQRGSFRVEQGRFAEVLSPAVGGAGLDLDGAYVIPGLVDIHTHGCAGADFSDGDAAGLRAMGRYYARNGVTSFAPTSMTLPYETLAAAYATAADYVSAPPKDGARLAGIHMEGPFFSEAKKGAQNPAYLRDPDFAAFRALYEGCGGLIAIADVAAELPGAAAFARQASALCTVSIAHTDASYEQAAEVFASGASHLTHLYNAMPAIHHRRPGPIGAASEREDVAAELICDGLHVHASAVRMAFKLFPGRICLISDSLRCCGMPDGEYELGGQPVTLHGRLATLHDGTIAGSATNLYDCMLTAIRFGIPPAQAILSATLLPAREVGKSADIGSIEPGKYADFIVCDRTLTRKAVYIGGEQIPSGDKNYENHQSAGL